MRVSLAQFPLRVIAIEKNVFIDRIDREVRIVSNIESLAPCGGCVFTDCDHNSRDEIGPSSR
jgi:hypothetical protein